MATKSQAFAVSGTFNVPSDITSAWLTMIAGGGGGGGCSVQPGYGGGGGGSGEFVTMMPIKVTPSASVSVTIGAAGVGGSNAGTAGGDSSFGVITVKGGKGGKNNAAFGVQTAGDGGGDNGGHTSTWAAISPRGGLSPWHFTGGGSGGWSGTENNHPGGDGAPSINGHTGGVGGSGIHGTGVGEGGGGGAASPFGNGADGADWVPNSGANGDSAVSTAYGAGGGGASANNNVGPTRFGGNGAGGYCLIQWID